MANLFKCVSPNHKGRNMICFAKFFIKSIGFESFQVEYTHPPPFRAEQFIPLQGIFSIILTYSACVRMRNCLYL